MKNNKHTKMYGLMGQILCGAAGAIIGFVFGGVGLAILGVLPGVLVGKLLEKSVLKPV